ncbi:MAG: NAD-dependent epimerase/dehydratase family protein [Elusimicrobiota bacterium]|jgi:UDP-glucose 4-epimerase
MARPLIVITGGAGFIGTHLAERLLKHSSVVLYDNLRRDSLSMVPSLKRRAVFINGDVLDRPSLEAAFDGADTVIHLAAIAGVSSYYSMPLQTLRVNLLGTVNALESAVARRVRRFIHVSTSEVFGPDALWVKEGDYHRVGGVSDKRWVYATSKLASEQFVMRTGEATGMKCTILRPFNVYGPRQTGEGAISNFCSAAAKGKPLEVYGDGTPLRAWCYISDFVDAVEAVLKRPASAGQDFNIGNPRETETTLGLARRVVRLAPRSKIRWRDVVRAEVRARVPCIDKARKVLGFEPKVDLDEGLKRTIAWFRKSGAR